MQRTVKFVKYLTRFGWEPIVLTVSGEYFDVIDEDIVKDVPGDTKIYRTKSLVSKKRTDVFRRETLRGQVNSALGRKRQITGMKNKFLWFIRDLILIPDTQVGWMPMAFVSAMKIIKKHKIDVIYTTGGPFSTFLTGYALKKLTRKPWLVDFRDAWTQFSYRAWENRFRKRVEHFMEHRILLNANTIVTATKSMSDYFGKVYPDIPASKFSVIQNGFDPCDFKNIPKKEFLKFTVCYTGQVRFDMYSPEYFFEAMALLLREFVEIRKNIQVIFVGTFAEDCKSLISEYGLKDVVKIMGYVPHREAISYQKSADVLLMFLNVGHGGEEMLTGKLLEYLNHEIPILALIPKESEAAKLICRTEAGVVVHPKNIQNIKENLYNYYMLHKEGRLSMKKVERGVLERYNRIELTGKLAELLQDIG
ncbi:MAG: glycosyltransferase family 4 protein [Gemmatimonadota bacterium]|nr:MAG: glycosyltransferase family 4 protein [Gemmatimonadota bacterium]